MKYYYREIGETDWIQCDLKWFKYCEKSPEHDTMSGDIIGGR